MTNWNKYTAMPEHARCRILIFDSAALLAKNLTDVLGELGYVDVHALTTSKLVMATLLKTVRYHAILVDLSLPDLEGLRLIYQIREHFSAAELPILAIADVDPPDVCNAALLAGANDFLAKPVDRISLALRLRNQLTINSIHNATRVVRHQLERQAANAAAQLNMLIDNSALLAANQDRQALIRHTLFEGKRLLHCDAASMYLVTERKTLRFAMRTRDDTLPVPEIPLFDPQCGEPNERYVSTYCALHKRSVVIDDVYSETRFDLSGTREFDTLSGYRTVSLLTVPMVSGDGKVVGVLQYINKLDSITEAFATFHPDLVALVEALASQVAVALDNLSLHHLRKLHAAIERQQQAPHGQPS